MQANQVVQDINVRQQAVSIVPPTLSKLIQAALDGFNQLVYELHDAANNEGKNNESYADGYFSKIIINEDEEAANFAPFDKVAEVAPVSQEASLIPF